MMWVPQARCCLVLAICLASVNRAHAAPLCNGLIYGKGHAFVVKAPAGWTLDNVAGVNQGLHAVFYPY
jgi:hypothetical protein